MDGMNIDIRALAEVMKPPEDSDSEDEQPISTYAKLGPGDLGPTKKTVSKDESAETKHKNTKSIWDEDDVPEGAEFDDIHDPRMQPEHDIVYKQAVTSEDMFLQMGNKTPGTSSCEDMIVKIKLPDTKISDVDLDVKKTFLDCRTPKYKLGLHLPHPVDSKSGKAQWNGTTETLSVTLRMSRDYDFVNF